MMDAENDSKDHVEKKLFLANIEKFQQQNDVKSVKVGEERIPKQTDTVFMPPFNKFLHGFVTHDKRVKFFKDIRPGDTVVGVVDRITASGIYISLLCVDLGFERDVSDQSLEAFIEDEELYQEEHQNSHFSHVYRIETYVRALVLQVDTGRQELFLGIRTTRNCPQRLGIVSHSELPLYFRESESIKGRHYGKMLKKSTTFRNPSSLGLLCDHFGINQKAPHSFFPDVKNADYREENLATHLRKVQSARLATKSVARGVERFRAGANAEALQHFNKALQVDPDHVEALVARGALYANSSSFSLAIGDFEKALKVEPDHFNAQKYLAETLKAHANSLKEKGQKVLADRCRQKADDIVSNLEVSSKQQSNGKGSKKKRRISLDSIAGLLPKSFEGILNPELEAKLQSFYEELREAGRDPPDVLEAIERLGGPSVSSLEEHLKKYYSRYGDSTKKHKSSKRGSTVSISSDDSSDSSTSRSSSSERKSKRRRSSKEDKSDQLEEKRKLMDSSKLAAVTPTHSSYNQFRRTASTDGRMNVTSAPDANGKPPAAPPQVLTEADVAARKKLKDMETFIKQLKMKPPKK